MQMKPKMENMKTKSQLADKSSNSKRKVEPLSKRNGVGSSQSTSNIQHAQMQMPNHFMDRNSFIIIEAANEKSETQYTMIEESKQNTNSKP